MIVKDSWVDTDVRDGSLFVWSKPLLHSNVPNTGDVVNVIGEFTTPGASSSSARPVPTITIDAKTNLLILHPDILITATSLSNASHCLRKPLIAGLIRSPSDTNALVWGNMLHEVMQICLDTGRWDDQWVDKQIAEVIRRNLGDVMRLGLSAEQAQFEVKLRAKGLQAFSQKYISDTPKVSSYESWILLSSNVQPIA